LTHTFSDNIDRELFRTCCVDILQIVATRGTYAVQKALSIRETSTYPEDFYTISAQLAVILGPTELLSGGFE
jgi:hypothetical protein